jgi:superfamily II DNA or RNA helicase
MADYFTDKGVRAVAVHSGERSAPRASALEALADGRLDILFAVDMFNEGLDIPNVDTVLMLRPTESSVIWLQQFGRGLRRAEGKAELRVIDYIGNHRAFLIKVRSLLQPLLGNGGLLSTWIATTQLRRPIDSSAGCCTRITAPSSNCPTERRRRVSRLAG